MLSDQSIGELNVNFDPVGTLEILLKKFFVRLQNYPEDVVARVDEADLEFVPEKFYLQTIVKKWDGMGT